MKWQSFALLAGTHASKGRSSQALGCNWLGNTTWRAHRHLREGGVTEHHSATFLEKALDKEATHNPSVALGASKLRIGSSTSRGNLLAAKCAHAASC